MDELILWTLPKLAILALFIWYLRVATRSMSLAPGKESALSRQLDMMAEVERTGRLLGTLAANQEARLSALEAAHASTVPSSV